MSAITQHNAEIHENRAHWERKPWLRQVYAEFYREIASKLVGLPPGHVIECGAGIGNLKSVLPQCIATDLFPNPWLDQVENVYALSFGDSTAAAIILFDVFHHLEYPGTALKELERVLVPGGRVIIFEPAMGLLGRIALGLFHHEPLALRAPLQWLAPRGFDPNQHRYYAAQGNAWRIFLRKQHEGLGAFTISEISAKPALPWLLTGGFRGRQLCPRWAQFLAEGADRIMQLTPRIFASRMLIVLEKTQSS